ncbi:MAG: response regulator transcription factor [Proteobacteria bacterium]|nr:response regulator transcription factor [Pseudomonadota bacterium]
MRILVVEDHQDLAENIGDYLSAKGEHILDFAMDGLGGMHLALTQEYDVIVLDIMLPGMDGLTLCRRLREEANDPTPVLMLTARDTLSDKLVGFESGADDYLVKPFALEELAARITALSKRKTVKRPSRLKIEELELDLGIMTVTRDGRRIELNRACLTLLKTLMEAHPNVVSRRDLEFALWGDMPPGSDALRSHMYTLRHKVDKPFPYPMLQTVHGIGFRLREKDES